MLGDRPKHAKELNKLLGKDANLFHKAAREVSIRSNFRHHDPAARKDDLWAVLISQLCNLRSLALHIEVEMNDHRFEARTQSMDQLMEWAVGGRKLRHFQHLELMSMFAVVPFTALCRPIAAPLRVPKFIGSHASFLRIPTMKLYATDFFVPQNMPTSSISCLDMSESYHHTYYGGLGDLSPYFLLSRSELRQLCWASSNLDYLNSCHVPGSLKHLKIHHTGELRSYAYQARGLDYPGSSIGRKNFSQLEILEIHYKTLEDEFVRDRSFDAPQELLVFGYEKWSDSDQYGLTYQQLQKMVTCWQYTNPSGLPNTYYGSGERDRKMFQRGTKTVWKRFHRSPNFIWRVAGHMNRLLLWMMIEYALSISHLKRA